MITERDLDEAIAKCQGESNPTNSTCMKLAAFLTIKDYLYPHYEEPHLQYSYASEPEHVENYIQTNGDSEFLKAVDGRKVDKVWKLIDELVEAVKILHPRMYTTFIDKVQDL